MAIGPLSIVNCYMTGALIQAHPSPRACLLTRSSPQLVLETWQDRNRERCCTACRASHWKKKTLRIMGMESKSIVAIVHRRDKCPQAPAISVLGLTHTHTISYDDVLCDPMWSYVPWCALFFFLTQVTSQPLQLVRSCTWLSPWWLEPSCTALSLDRHGNASEAGIQFVLNARNPPSIGV